MNECGVDSVCGDSDGCVGCYTVSDNQEFDDQEGHGSFYNGFRAHFRIWYAPHSHSSVVDKWSTIDAHHEKTCICTKVHVIDEDWETWEYHIGSELGASVDHIFNNDCRPFLHEALFKSLEYRCRFVGGRSGHEIMIYDVEFRACRLR